MSAGWTPMLTDDSYEVVKEYVSAMCSVDRSYYNVSAKARLCQVGQFLVYNEF